MSQDTRKRKVKARFWPTWRYSLRWEDLDGCTGEGGHGLIAGLRTWWQVRRGTWRDDMLDGWLNTSQVCDDGDHGECMYPGCECVCHA